MTDWNKVLKAHRKQFGTVYQLPNGTQVMLKDTELKTYLTTNKLQVKQPSYQATNEIEAQVGIK